jgi:hypothetical protein
MLRNLESHLAKVTYTEVGFKLCPCVYDVKVGLKNVKLLAFATENCWLSASREKTIGSNGINELVGKLVVHGKFCFIYLMGRKLDFAIR